MNLLENSLIKKYFGCRSVCSEEFTGVKPSPEPEKSCWEDGCKGTAHYGVLPHSKPKPDAKLISVEILRAICPTISAEVAKGYIRETFALARKQ